MAPRRRTMLSANLRRVWKTPEEKDRDASLPATWKREGVNVNVLQARNDIFDEGKTTTTHRYGTKSTQKEYGPKIDAKTATNNSHWKKLSKSATLCLSASAKEERHQLSQ